MSSSSSVGSHKKKVVCKTVRAHPYPLRNRLVGGQIDTTSIFAPKCIDCSNTWTLAGYLRCNDCHFIYENPGYIAEWRSRTFETVDEKDIQEFDAIKGSQLKREMVLKHLPVLRTYWEKTQDLTKRLESPYERTPYSAPYVAPVFFELVPSVLSTLDLDLVLLDTVTDLERKKIQETFRDQFIRSLKKESFGKEVKRLIRDCYEKRGFLFWAYEADDLIHHFYNVFGKEGGLSNHLMHAIGPYIYDVWNCKCAHGDFLCYYKSFGELTRVPLWTKELFKLWDLCNDAMHYGFSQ